MSNFYEYNPEKGMFLNIFISDFLECMNFFAVVLCRLDEAKTSLQNAHNWGYFDPESGSWNGDL